MSEWQTINMHLRIWRGQISFPIEQKAKKSCLTKFQRHAKRILDLGTGDGRLLSLVKLNLPKAEGVALDFSEPMLEKPKNDSHKTRT